MSTWREELTQFKNDNEQTAAVLADATPAQQLTVLKALAASRDFVDEYPTLADTINHTPNLTRNLFDGCEVEDQDDEEIYDELSNYLGDNLTAEVRATFADLDHDLDEWASSDTLNDGGEGETLNDSPSGNPTVTPVTFEYHDGNSGFSVSETNRDAFIDAIVQNVRTRRENGQTLPEAFQGLSDNYVAQVAAARFDNARAATGGEAVPRHEYAAKKASYGAAA